jgi:hypothetical protein
MVGRFLEEDPKGFAAGDPNLFRYTRNSPTNATDPSGLDYIVASNKAGADAIVRRIREIEEKDKKDYTLELEVTKIEGDKYIIRAIGVRRRGRVEYDLGRVERIIEYLAGEYPAKENDEATDFLRHVLFALKPGREPNYNFTGTAADQFKGKFSVVEDKKLIGYVEGVGLARKVWVDKECTRPAHHVVDA